MNKGRGIGLGLFLLTLGIVWALANVGIVNWSIVNSLLILWPLILVAVGISVIFHKHWAVRVVTWVLFLAVLIGHSYYFGDRNNSKTGFSLNSSNKNVGSSTDIDKPEGLQKAKLELALGACGIDLAAGAARLVESKIDDNNIISSTSFSSDNSSGTISFENKNHSNFNWKQKSTNSFRLNEDVLWDIDVDTGVSECNLDLSKLKVNSLKYDGGVSELNITFGDRSNYTKVDIETGVSKIGLKVPESAGVRVRTDKGLSTADFDGEGWVKKDGFYETDNYGQASSKLEINAEIGVSTFKVERIR